jgi:glycosyltransferase involved in cell wall biosynthesis
VVPLGWVEPGKNIAMQNVPRKPGRWLWAIPMVYSEEGAFWVRDGGLAVLGLRMVGVDARFVALGQPGERKDGPSLTCTLGQMQEAAWWKQWEVDGVFLNSWALPRYELIARAIKSAGLRVILMLDNEGIVSPHVWPWRYLRQKYFVEKDGKKWLPACRALLKTAAASFRLRHAGTIRHLEHAELIVLPSPLAQQRYSHYLLAMKRGDLISRLRCAPYAVVTEMSYESTVAKKPVIIAVGRWQSLQKNTPLLLRILERVLSEQPQYSARIIGSGAEIVQKLAQRLKPDCRSRIEIVGRVDHAKLPAYYGESQIFLCTSRYESFLIAAGEALCCGCSVVGDATIASMPYFTELGSGTLSSDSSLDNLRNALMTEIDAWQSGHRDPVQISRAWQARLHPDHVAEALLKFLQ